MALHLATWERSAPVHSPTADALDGSWVPRRGGAECQGLWIGWRPYSSPTIRGDQEARKALRLTLYVQFKIRDNDVFEKALGYVREYY